MKLADLERMNEVENDHWWFAGKRELFRRLLARRLQRGGLHMLDVGCGTGATSSMLRAYGTVTSLDRSPDALRFARERGAHRPVVADAAKLPFRSGCFDLITAFDVLEHVEDDHAMAADLKRILAPGGAVAVHVPAWPFMFSRHDEVLEHKRRYTRKSLRRLLEGAGFRLEYYGWASFAIWFPAAILRTAEKFLPRKQDAEADVYGLPGPLNALMRLVYRAEAAVAAGPGLPIGVSLAAIAVVDDGEAVESGQP